MKRYEKYKSTKRYTITEWVDVDSGEMLSRQNKEENYRIVNTIVKYEHKERQNGTHIEQYILKTITRECKQKEQLKLEL